MFLIILGFLAAYLCTGIIFAKLAYRKEDKQAFYEEGEYIAWLIFAWPLAMLCGLYVKIERWIKTPKKGEKNEVV